jgi:PBP1b-binding outer membrane lipoprotein LpoB
MKTAYVLLIIIAVLACGCTSAPQAAPAATAEPAAPAEPVIPDLVGTWTGPMTGYQEDIGFTDYHQKPMSMVVTEQQGRIFAGHLVITLSNATRTTPFAGVIAKNGKTFSMVENENGYSHGEIIADNSIELTWMTDKTPIGAALDTLKRE